MPNIRVLLADDHPVIRRGVRTLIDHTTDIIVIAEATTGLEVIPLVTQLQPDILLLDMKLPGISGIEVARQLRTSRSPVRILGFSAHTDAQFVRTLILNGAAGYLLKEEAPEIIIEALRSVARGENGWYSRRAVAKMDDWVQQDSSQTHRITGRELDVLSLLVAGKTNQEIAAGLVISPKTVEKHIHSLFVKFDATSRVEVAVYAIQKGLV